MGLKEFLSELNDDTKVVIADSFKLELTKATALPSVDDQGLTFEDFDNKSKKAKVIETCVLHIDLRQSTKLNLEHSPVTLSRLYSCFIRGAIKCAEWYGGEAKNIAGDRVMIVFKPDRCFEKAVNTAILLNTFSSYILNKHFKDALIKCGIGIDFGRMLVMKVGAIKQGNTNAEHKSLVWLGAPANVASKLADMANKSFSRSVVKVAKNYPWSKELDWADQEMDEFFNGLQMTYSYPMIAQFKEPFVWSFFKSASSVSHSAILITDRVFNGFKAECPTDNSIVNQWWKSKHVDVSGFNGALYEAAVYFSFAEQLS